MTDMTNVVDWYLFFLLAGIICGIWSSFVAYGYTFWKWDMRFFIPLVAFGNFALVFGTYLFCEVLL